MDDQRLYLIDATAFCYRAFYALPGLTTSFGQPTNAVFGFVSMLNKILAQNRPEYLAVCFDVSRDTFRQKKFAEYKIQRPPMPDSLSSQMGLIKEIIQAYRITVLEKIGYEADDIIATLNRKAKENGMKITIISSDKDILQLVDNDTAVFSPYKDEGVLYNQEKVKERFGVRPTQIPDIIALMGDSVDNIPGAKGIGEKTAIDLIKQFGSVENLLKDMDKIESERFKKIIQDNIERIKLSKELALLNKEIDIDFDLKKIKISTPNYKELFRLFKYLEFKKFLKELPIAEKSKQELKIDKLKDKELKDFFTEESELIFYLDKLDEMVFFIKNKFFQLTDFSTNIKKILEDPSIKKISHDLKKIKIFLAKNNIILRGLYFDTMIAGYLVNPSLSSYSIFDLALIYLNEHLDINFFNPQRVVGLIQRLRPKLEKELNERSLRSLFANIEMPLIEVLAEMELNGIKLDLSVLKDLSGDLEKRLIKLIDKIYDSSGTQFNINSPKQLRDILFERLKLPVVKKSKTGPSTDEEVLRKLVDKHELPALLLEYRQLIKLKNTYVDILPELVDSKTNRIHTSFNQTATETGRLSSSNPNLQNIPIKTDIGKNIRRSIMAYDKDSLLLSCDYSQVELRILAHLSGDENLLWAFKNDLDIHKATAALIYGLKELDVTDKMREVAKRVNFGIIYGLSSYGLSRDLNIAAEEAKSFIDAYFIRYPKVKDYIDQQIKRAKKDGFVTTILGRRRYLPEINNKNQTIRQFAERQAVNTPIQGSAADLIKLAMIKIHQQLVFKKLKTKMILQIHDELLFNADKEEINEVTSLIKEIMENVLKLKVPIKVDIKKGKNWLEMEEI